MAYVKELDIFFSIRGCQNVHIGLILFIYHLIVQRNRSFCTLRYINAYCPTFLPFYIIFFISLNTKCPNHDSAMTWNVPFHCTVLFSTLYVRHSKHQTTNNTPQSSTIANATFSPQSSLSSTIAAIDCKIVMRGIDQSFLPIGSSCTISVIVTLSFLKKILLIIIFARPIT